MSVISMIERMDERSGQRDRATSSYSREFQVRTSVGTDDAGTVLAYGSLPQVGDAYPGDSRAVCSGLRARPDQSDPCTWSVVVDYSSGGRGMDLGSEPPEALEDPTAQPAEVEWSEYITREAVREDNEANPLVNSAGDAFDPLPEQEVYDLMCTITRIEDNYNPARALSFLGKVNESACWIAYAYALPRQCLCQQYSGSKVVVDGKPYWRVTYRFIFRDATWDLRLLNAGFYYLRAASTLSTRTRFLAADKTYRETPGLLKVDGTEETDPAAAVYLAFTVRGEANFNALDLERA